MCKCGAAIRLCVLALLTIRLEVTSGWIQTPLNIGSSRRCLCNRRWYMSENGGRGKGGDGGGRGGDAKKFNTGTSKGGYEKSRFGPGGASAGRGSIGGRGGYGAGSDVGGRGPVSSSGPKGSTRRLSGATKNVVDQFKLTSNERLQKVLSHAGIDSRRQCEQMILDGRVKVNGKIIVSLGHKVDPLRDEVLVDGKSVSIRSKQETVWVCIHKPKGVITSTKDESGRRTVVDLIPSADRLRLLPIGRLDRDSAGLLLLTNDNAWVNVLTHPSYGQIKVYRVTITNGEPSAPAWKRITQGMMLEGEQYPTQPCEVEIVNSDDRRGLLVLDVTLREGKNRQLRRMFEDIGHPVKSITRTRQGPIRLKQLLPGEWRTLTPMEVTRIKSKIKPPTTKTTTTSPSTSNTSKDNINTSSTKGKENKTANSVLGGEGWGDLDDLDFNDGKSIPGGIINKNIVGSVKRSKKDVNTDSIDEYDSHDYDEGDDIDYSYLDGEQPDMTDFYENSQDTHTDMSSEVVQKPKKVLSPRTSSEAKNSSKVSVRGKKVDTIDKREDVKKTSEVKKSSISTRKIATRKAVNTQTTNSVKRGPSRAKIIPMSGSDDLLSEADLQDIVKKVLLNNKDF